MEVLAIIPARSGSKGVKNKNKKLLAGYPLIAYSVISAKKSNLISRVIVSTDDEHMAEIAWTWGAEVPFMRPAEIAGDYSRDIETFQHALNALKNKDGYEPDLVVQLRPTSPIRPRGLIDDGIQKLAQDEQASSVRSMVRSKENPYKMWHQRGHYMSPVLSDPQIPEAYNAPRQILHDTYFQTGHLDVIRPQCILGGSMSGGYISPIMIDPIYCLDIDTDDDWRLATAKVLNFPYTSEVYFPGDAEWLS